MIDEDELVQEILATACTGSDELKTRHLKSVRRYLYLKAGDSDDSSYHLRIQQRQEALTAFMVPRFSGHQPTALAGISAHRDPHTAPVGSEGILTLAGQYPQIFASLLAVSQDTSNAWKTARQEWSTKYPNVQRVTIDQINAKAPTPVTTLIPQGARTFKTVHVKYVFIDIVDFTVNRSDEAQAFIVAELNEVVNVALSAEGIKNDDNCIMLPTGDGMCICLVGRDYQYNTHIELACGIVAGVQGKNEFHKNDPERTFKVRIGVNEGNDNLIIDINRKSNLCGRAINTTQRIMAQADGQQIMIGPAVYEAITGKKQYMNFFISFNTHDKHNNALKIYLYRDNTRLGLNTALPSKFSTPSPTPFVLYYLAHCIENVEFIQKARDNDSYSEEPLLTLLYLRSLDSVEKEQADAKRETYTPHTLKGTFEEQYKYYKAIDWKINMLMSQMAKDTYLSRYDVYFVGDPVSFRAIADAEGIEVLRQHWHKLKMTKEFPRTDDFLKRVSARN